MNGGGWSVESARLIIKFEAGWRSIRPGGRRQIELVVKHGFRVMAQGRNNNAELTQENVRLRAQVAQLEDKLDHFAEHGKASRASQEAEVAPPRSDERAFGCRADRR